MKREGPLADRASFPTMADFLADATKVQPPDDDSIAWRAYIEARLEYAGATMLALYSRVWPAGFRNLWGGSGNEDRKRYDVPTARAISLMDAAFDWVPVAIEDPALRHLVSRRSLVVPDSPPDRPRYVWSWSRLVEHAGLVKTGPNVEMFRRRWIAGIDRIAAHATPRRTAMVSDLVSRPRTGRERALIGSMGR